MKSILIISALACALLFGSCRDNARDPEERDAYENSTDTEEITPAVPDTTTQENPSPTQQDTLKNP